MENQRVRLTKKMLKNALVQLMESKPLEKITIYELCAKAEINRTTFYKYYGSQYDLLDDIKADFLHELEISLHDDPPPVGLQNILTYILTHRLSCMALLHTAPYDGFLESVLSLSPVMRQMDEMIEPVYSGYQRDYVKKYMIFGAYSIIREWLLSEHPEPPEDIARLISGISARITSSAEQPIC